MTINLKKIFTQNKLLLFFVLLFIFIQIIISSIYPYLTKLIIDHVLLKHQLEDLKKILLLTLALILIQLPINVGVSYLCAKWTQTIIYRLREQLGILFITHKENAQKNGLFINTLSNDCELIGNQLLTIILNSVPNILLIFLYVLILFQLNKKLTFWALLIIPLFLIISFITSKQVFRLTKKSQYCRDQLIAFLNAHVRNKLLISLYHLHAEEKKKFLTVSKQVKQTNVKTNTILAFLNNLASLITVIVPLFTLFMGSIMVIHQEMTLGTLIAFNSYTSLLFTPLSKILTLPPTYSQMKASVERIEQTEFIESSFQQGNYLKTLKTHKTLLQTIDLIPYSQNTPLFINPLNFKIEKGEIWQLTGPNGCGKSILLKCFIHYHENFSGTIQLAKDTLVAYVPQESFLFEGTVKDNLLKGLQQPQLEQLTYFIQLFKFDVPLTQKVTPFNLNLSSGQLQKIKLIRALLSKPDILLLDEVFANLDTTTVNTLITYIQEIKLTTVFVYHGNLSQLISKENYHQILIFKTETKGLFSNKIMS